MNLTKYDDVEYPYVTILTRKGTCGCFDFQNTCPRETRWKTSFGKWIAVAVGFLLAKSRLLPQHAISIACFLYGFWNHN